MSSHTEATLDSNMTEARPNKFDSSRTCRQDLNSQSCICAIIFAGFGCRLQPGSLQLALGHGAQNVGGNCPDPAWKMPLEGFGISRCACNL